MPFEKLSIAAPEHGVLVAGDHVARAVDQTGGADEVNSRYQVAERCGIWLTRGKFAHIVRGKAIEC